jgi:hypothetical protein
MKRVARRLMIAVPLAGLVTLGLAGAAAAADGWAKPIDLGRSGVRGFETASPALATATDGHGEILVAWRSVSRHGRQGIDFTVHGHGGRFGRARTVALARGTVSDPRVAMDASGDALVVFTRIAPGGHTAKIMVVAIGAGGRPAAPRQISPSGVSAETPAVAIDDGGAATIVFQRDRPFVKTPAGPVDALGIPDVVMAATRPAGGRFGTAQAISAAVKHASFEAGALAPAVSMSGDGEAVAAWYRNVSLQLSQAHATGDVEAAVAPPSGEFGTPGVVAVTAKPDLLPQTTLTEDTAGNTVLTWQDQTGLSAAVRPAGGAFSTPTNFAVPYDQGTYPAIAFGPDDTAQLVWAQCQGPCDALISTATWTPGDALTAQPAITPLGMPRDGPSTPALTFAAGRPVVTWQELGAAPSGGPGDPGTQNIGLEDAIGPAGNALGPAALLSPASHGGTYHHPPDTAGRAGFGGLFLATTLAGGGTGPVYAVWEQANHTVQASQLALSP